MIQRPCLACTTENDLAATQCSRCGRSLSSWAERAGTSAPLQVAHRLPSRRSLLLAALIATLAITFGPSGLHWLSTRGRVAPGPTWREPATIATWAEAELRSAGVEAVSLDARVEKRSLAARRLVLAGHSTGQPLLDVVRATARFLVLARDKGEATATHLAIIRQGTRILLLPVGDAVRVAASDEAAASWLELQERLRPAGADFARRGADVGPTLGPAWPPPATSDLSPRPSLAPSVGDLVSGAEASPGPALVAVTAPPPGPTPSVDASRPVVARGTPLVPPSASRPPGAAPPVRLLKTTAGAALPGRVQPGQEGVVLLRAQIHPGTRRALKLDSVRVRARGTLPDVEDVSFVDLVRDVDRDGKRGPGDVSLGGRQSFTDDDGLLSFDELGLTFGEDGIGIELIFTADLADESLGGTILLALMDAGSVSVAEVASGNQCGVRGVPLTGPVVSVDSNVEEDPEQARLDALAEAGPDAVDENLNNSGIPTNGTEVVDSGREGTSGASGPSGSSGTTGPVALTPVSPFPRRR